MAENNEKKMGFLGYLFQAWLVLVLASCFGVSLALVEGYTRPIIAENVKQRIAGKLVEMFGEGTTTNDPTVLEVQMQSRLCKIDCYPAYGGGKLIGWGVLAHGQAYDTLTLLIGVDARVETLKGYRVIKSLETPGIGDRIKSDKSDFSRQFEGQSTATELTFVFADAEAGPGQINGISGATISSKGVVKIINNHLASVRDKLAALEAQQRQQQEEH